MAERGIRRIARLLEQKGFRNPDEARAYLNTLVGESVDGLPWEDGDPIEQAEELVFDALEADTDEEARRLTEAALKLDPDCVDALTLIAQLADSPMKSVSKLRAAVEAGESRLGKDFFEENKGYFWGLIETRPYMRARQQLAASLLITGKPFEAAEHYSALLELCPNDNLGVRFELLSLYLTTDQMEKALGLVEKYPKERSAFFHWASVLIYFSLRRFEDAKRALKAARRANRHVEEWLLDDDAQPVALPDFYGIGDRKEAQFCIFYQGLAWRVHPLAQFWLTTAGQPGDGDYLGALSVVYGDESQ
jgi:hypothetical protein